MRSLAVRALSAVAIAGLLAVCAAAARAQEERDAYRLFLPGNQRALDIDLRGHEVSYVDLVDDALAPGSKPDKAKGAANSAANSAAAPARLLLVTFRPEKGKRKWPASFVVRVEEARADAGALREAAIERLLKLDGVSKDGVKREAYKQAALLRYATRGPQLEYFTFTGLSPIPVRSSFGSAMKFPVVEAFQVQAGVSVWLRRNSFGIENEDEENILRTLLDSVRVVDTSQPSTSFDHYHLGRAHYQRKEYGAAVAALTRALDLERERRQLGRSNWRQLIMTLANAHGATDDVARAREVLEYGVGAEPTYAFFHHGLARLHGLFGDADAAVAALRKAFEHAPKERFLSYGGLPDPMTDVAFGKFKNDPKFRDAVKAMKKQFKK